MTMPSKFSGGDPVYFLVKPNSSTGILEPVIATEGFETASDQSMINLTKFPIAAGKNFTLNSSTGEYNIKGAYSEVGTGNITSITKESGTPPANLSYTVYFMLQATGFKLKSNKELPGPVQRFSQIIPRSTISGTGDTISSSKPSVSQIYPMFAKIDINTSVYDTTGLNINLIAIANIVPNDITKVLNQQTAWDINSYTEKTAILPPALKYFDNSNDNYIPYGKIGQIPDGDGGYTENVNACWSNTECSLNLHI
jgi:hypothetical protein